MMMTVEQIMAKQCPGDYRPELVVSPVEHQGVVDAIRVAYAGMPVEAPEDLRRLLAGLK